MLIRHDRNTPVVHFTPSRQLRHTKVAASRTPLRSRLAVLARLRRRLASATSRARLLAGGLSHATSELCHEPLEEAFVDGKPESGAWGCLCLSCHAEHSQGLGPGRGLLYERDGEEFIQSAAPVGKG